MQAFVEGTLFLGEVIPAFTLRKRMRGLLGRNGLSHGTGMLLDPCGSVHTFCMKFPIDLVFLDSNYRVVAVHLNVGAGRIVFGGLKARRVIEYQSGGSCLPDIRRGQQVRFGE